MPPIDTNKDLADPSKANVADKSIKQPSGLKQRRLGERRDKQGEKDGLMVQ